MALAAGWGNVVHRSQGARLCCWKSCLEMVMMWRHQTIFGRTADGPRQAHTAAVQAADLRNRGYQIGLLAADYGLAQFANLTADRATWVAALGVSPMILSGRYGMARASRVFGFGGHVIVAVGFSRTDQIVYFDPFRTGWSTVNNYMYMSLADAWARLDKPFNLPEAYVAPA